MKKCRKLAPPPVEAAPGLYSPMLESIPKKRGGHENESTFSGNKRFEKEPILCGEKRQKLFAAKERMCAVDHLSLYMEEGETYGLVGESGCGKIYDWPYDRGT